MTITTDLEGAFESVWREAEMYKLYKTGISNNPLVVLTSFLRCHHQYRKFVNAHLGNWSDTTSGAPQRSILSPLIFFVYTADMTAEEENTTEHELNESK